MSHKYILTVDGYIENYQVGNNNILSDNQKLYDFSSITGSKIINSKYDSATDSFIEPINVTNLSAPLLIDDTKDSIEYFTGSLPVTLSFNRTITTDPILPSTINASFLTEKNERVPIEELEANNNKLQFKLNPSLSQDIDWENFPSLELIEIRVNVGNLEFDSPNNRPHPTLFPYKTSIEYSKSVI